MDAALTGQSRWVGGGAVGQQEPYAMVFSLRSKLEGGEGRKDHLLNPEVSPLPERKVSEKHRLLQCGQ